jgi:chemotaxis protein histidine kinase CheA
MVEEVTVGVRRAEDDHRARVEAIGDRVRRHNARRIAVIVQAVAALRDDRLDEAGRLAAQREAHTIAGGAAMFGYSAAGEAALDLEQLFEGGPDRTSWARASDLVRRMREAFAQPPGRARATEGDLEGGPEDDPVDDPRFG